MKKLKGKKQVNGEFEPTTLDQLLGYTGLAKYGTMVEAEYIEMMQNLNKSDLHSHAIKHGIMPIENRQRLENTLVKEFRKYVNTFKQPKAAKDKNTKMPSQRVLDILAEGR